MSTDVTELGRDFSEVRMDTILVFPNIITCVALVAPSGSHLVGAHMTGFEDLATLGQQIRSLADERAHAFYAVGPISSGYVPWRSHLRTLGLRNIQQYDTTYSAGGIDVRATANSGEVTFEKKPHGAADTAYERIPRSHFSCAIQ